MLSDKFQTYYLNHLFHISYKYTDSMPSAFKPMYGNIAKMNDILKYR